jgi:predicted amidophosphoribosyltransferase
MFSADVIVPLLLHRGGMRQRRFNQTETREDAVRELLDLSVLARAVRRVTATVLQVELTERRVGRNVCGVFSATGAAPATRRAFACSWLTTSSPWEAPSPT